MSITDPYCPYRPSTLTVYTRPSESYLRPSESYLRPSESNNPVPSTEPERFHTAQKNYTATHTQHYTCLAQNIGHKFLSGGGPYTRILHDLVSEVIIGPSDHYLLQ